MVWEDAGIAGGFNKNRQEWTFPASISNHRLWRWEFALLDPNNELISWPGDINQ
jgi:hypothetical protein